jgi:deoxyhypusine synthase
MLVASVRYLDLRRLNSQAVYARSTGVIILGGGLIKHHICNANLMVCAV